MIWIGIDCGFDGAIAMRRNADLICAFPTPTLDTGGRDDYDRDAIRRFMASLPKVSCQGIIERQWARPGQAYAFTLGRSYELWVSAFSFFEIPFSVVTPAQWKKDLGIDPKIDRDARKREAIKMAQSLFPDFDFKRETTYRGKKLEKIYHDGMAEAALLTEWARRKAL